LYIDIEIKKGGVLMRQKLTKMTIEELEDYRQRWTKKLGKYQQGSKNWQKIFNRMKKATKQLGKIS
jgi:hypothetical protein